MLALCKVAAIARWAAILLALLLGPVQTVAAYGSATQADLGYLPPYCRATRLFDPNLQSADYKYWLARLGSNQESLHHHCQGLIHLRKARLMPGDSLERQRLLGSALGEFNFLLRRPDATLKTFPLWAEFLVLRGNTAVLAEQWPLAVESFDKARSVKPDYWPAYLDWSAHLARLKLNQQARDVLRQGLQLDPSVEAMRAAYVKLGGSLRDLPDRPAEPPPTASQPERSASEPPPSLGSPPASGASE